MKVKGILIHCSDSPQGRGDTAETIHRWHKERGWDGIGYHYVILEDGTVENGRPAYWDGSHARGFNSTHLGICLIGVDSFTDDQFDSLRGLIGKLKIDYHISDKNILGHCAVDERKTCPNFDVKEFLDKVS